MRIVPRHRFLQRCLVSPPPFPDTGAWRCIAFDISRNGIGITLPQDLPPETELDVVAWELPGALPLRVRVVRTWPVAQLWFCGCELVSRLGEAELRAWLKGAA
jgi:hypothetical protein